MVGKSIRMHVLFLYSRIDNCYRWTIGLIFLSTLKLLFWKSHVPLTFSSISVFEFHFHSVYCMQRMSTFGCMFIIMTLTVLEFFKTKNNIQFFFLREEEIYYISVRVQQYPNYLNGLR